MRNQGKTHDSNSSKIFDLWMLKCHLKAGLYSSFRACHHLIFHAISEGNKEKTLTEQLLCTIHCSSTGDALTEAVGQRPAVTVMGTPNTVLRHWSLSSSRRMWMPGGIRPFSAHEPHQTSQLYTGRWVRLPVTSPAGGRS